MRVRRVLKFASLGLALLLVVGLLVVLVLDLRLPGDDIEGLEPGRLSVSDSVVGTVDAGDITVDVATDRVQVFAGRRLLWSSPPGSAFVGAARGELEVEEHRGYFWPTTEFDDELSDQTIDSVEVSGESVVISGELDETAYDVTFRAADGGARVSVDVPNADAVALVSGRTEHAGVHGLGAQTGDFDLDGRMVPIIVREQGVGRGEQPLTFLADLTNKAAGGTGAMTYATWASWVSDDLRGVRLDPAKEASHSFATVDLTEADQVRLTSWASTIDATLSAGDDPEDLVAAQQKAATRTTLPTWTQNGAILGLQGGTEEVRRELETMQDAGVPIAGVWLQDWSGRRTTDFGERLWWTWQLDEHRYPGWAGLVADLKAQGIATTTYVNPFLVDAEPKGDQGIRNLYAEARDRGFLVRNADGEPYALDQGGFDAYLVDLTNVPARRWYARVIAEEVLADGVVGFMADFAEGLPFDADLMGADAQQMHNAWPLLWQDTVRDACELAKQPECLTWVRSGSLTDTAPIAWAGDQMVDFSSEDGLASALHAMLSAGVSGWPLMHSDIGGYTSINAVVKKYRRTPELLARWAELEAFGTLMRTHEGNLPDVNAQVFDSAETAGAFARMVKVFAALAPYRRTVIAEAERTGVPALRHGWLVEPGSDTANADEQFFLGADVLVAPVLAAEESKVEVALPEGEWVHLFTGTSYAGSRTATVDAPVGTPAAFVRADSQWSDRLVQAVDAALD